MGISLLLAATGFATLAQVTLPQQPQVPPAVENRVAVSTDDDPSRGPTSAPVTVVVFCDLGCPFCATFEATLHQVEQNYGNRVRIVARDFPDERLHPGAGKAAEAADCAGEQRRYWEMYDLILSRQGDLYINGLKRAARDLRLDTEAFGRCLDGGRYAREWQADREAGLQYGVTGTPSVFVNGRFREGLLTLDQLSALIDEELNGR
jgi:protein-disulfide isomerase